MSAEPISKSILMGTKGDGTLAPILIDNDGNLVVQLETSPTIDIGDVSLLAGTAIVGKFGIDQVTANANEVVLKASEAHAGALGGNATVITVTPTLTVAATYVANDFVGTSATAMAFANAARVSTGTGIVQSAVLVDYALQSIAGELWLFDAAPTPPADSAAWTISDADALKCIGVITFNTYYASALNSVSSGALPNGGIGFKSTGTSLWGCFVTRGAPAYATGDISIRLTIIQD